MRLIRVCQDINDDLKNRLEMSQKVSKFQNFEQIQ